MARTGKVVVVTGPSGVGKSTIVRELLSRTDAIYSVSATTRKPRPGEVEGRHYRFLDRPTFEKMIQHSELLEWAEVFGEYYGTPAAPVRRAVARGRTVILEIDVQGGRQVHEKMPDATFVFILPPSQGELKKRLSGRGTEPAGGVQQRFKRAQEEVREARESGIYTHMIVNDDLPAAIVQVVAIVTEEPEQA